jgi:hypothetical protein
VRATPDEARGAPLPGSPNSREKKRGYNELLNFVLVKMGINFEFRRDHSGSHFCGEKSRRRLSIREVGKNFFGRFLSSMIPGWSFSFGVWIFLQFPYHLMDKANGGEGTFGQSVPA